MQKLLIAMKIREGSFYNTFKSKQNLYLLCLNKYNKRSQNLLSTVFNNDKCIQQNLKTFFNKIITDLAINKSSQSCLMSNSLSLDVLVDPALKLCIVNETNSFFDSFKEIIKKAIDDKHLESNFEVDLSAQILVTYIHGLNKIALTDTPKKTLTEQTNFLLKQLDLF
jgi:TetR/AcrR family transcriptional repressor of nem operon